MVEIVENKDGSIFATLPLKALKLSIITAQGRGFASTLKQEEQEDDEKCSADRLNEFSADGIVECVSHKLSLLYFWNC